MATAPSGRLNPRQTGRWQFEGAISGTISCHHEPVDAGTDATTTFLYHIPKRFGGRIADRLVLERRMRREFEDSMDNLKLLAETSDVAAAMSIAA